MKVRVVIEIDDKVSDVFELELAEIDKSDVLIECSSKLLDVYLEREPDDVDAED